jgi:ubiquinone/menaquinone biosynthesis C-methylase UbiE
LLTVNFKKLGLNNGDALLDVGCGEGRHVIHACLEHNVLGLGVDISLRDLTIASERFKPFSNYNPHSIFSLQQTDATRLPFSDNSFDKIICSEVLEHIPDYVGVLQEIKRVLKPDGILALSVPRAWPEKICWWLSTDYHQVEGGHIRIFNARQLENEVKAMDFLFLQRHWAHALHSPFWWLKCLLWKSQDNSRIIKLYHRLLVWDLMHKPWPTQALEKILNPLLGKSVVLYFKKNDVAQRETLV